MSAASQRAATPRSTNNKKVSYQLAFHKCKESIQYKWSQILSVTEAATLTYLINRTLRFNKLSEIVLRNYVGKDTVSGKTGSTVLTGLNISTSTYSRNIKRLRELNLISCKIQTHRKGRVNVVTVYPDVITGMPMSHLKKSKKVKTKQGGSYHGDTMGSCHNDTIEVKEDNKSEVKEDKEIKTTASQGLATTILNVKAKSVIDRNKKSKHKTLSGTKALWSILYESTFPGVIYTNFTGREYSILKKNAKSIDIPMKDLIAWSMKNWMQLSRTKMSWAVEKGLMGCDPTPTSFSMLVRKFLQWYMDDEIKGTRVEFNKPRTKEPTASKELLPNIYNNVVYMKSISSKVKKRKSVTPTVDKDWNDGDIPDWEELTQDE